MLLTVVLSTRGILRFSILSQDLVLFSSHDAQLQELHTITYTKQIQHEWLQV